MTSLEGNDELVAFLSAYRTRPYNAKRRRGHWNKRGKLYYPVGALFYFPCDEYGIETSSPPVFITRVPNGPRHGDPGKALLFAGREKKRKDKLRISYSHKGYMPDTFTVKREIYQPPLLYADKRKDIAHE